MRSLLPRRHSRWPSVIANCPLSRNAPSQRTASQIRAQYIRTRIVSSPHQERELPRFESARHVPSSPFGCKATKHDHAQRARRSTSPISSACSSLRVERESALKHHLRSMLGTGSMEVAWVLIFEQRNKDEGGQAKKRRRKTKGGKVEKIKAESRCLGRCV